MARPEVNLVCMPWEASPFVRFTIGARIAPGPLGNQSRRFPPSKKADGAPLR